MPRTFVWDFGVIGMGRRENPPPHGQAWVGGMGPSAGVGGIRCCDEDALLVHGLKRPVSTPHPPPWPEGCKIHNFASTPGLTNPLCRLRVREGRETAPGSSIAHGDPAALDPTKCTHVPQVGSPFTRYTDNTHFEGLVFLVAPGCGERAHTPILNPGHLRDIAKWLKHAF